MIPILRKFTWANIARSLAFYAFDALIYLAIGYCFFEKFTPVAVFASYRSIIMAFCVIALIDGIVQFAFDRLMALRATPKVAA